MYRYTIQFCGCKYPIRIQSRRNRYDIWGVFTRRCSPHYREASYNYKKKGKKSWEQGGASNGLRMLSVNQCTLDANGGMSDSSASSYESCVFIGNISGDAGNKV